MLNFCIISPALNLCLAICPFLLPVQPVSRPGKGYEALLFRQHLRDNKRKHEIRHFGKRQPERRPALVPPLPWAVASALWAPRTLGVPETAKIAKRSSEERFSLPSTSKSTFMSHSMMDTAAAGFVSITFNS